MRSWMLMLAVVALPACGLFGGGENKGKAETVDAETFKKVVTLAKAVKKEPEKAQEILKESGLSRAQVEDAIYAIAADEEASEKYAKALKGDK